MQSRSQRPSKISTNFITLEEGFQQFGNDLNKLQVNICARRRHMFIGLLSQKQFVEINATAFSKILKKVCSIIPLWDTALGLLTRTVGQDIQEVQPCFNRDVISELSDQATTSLLELGAWSEGEKVDFGGRSIDRIVPIDVKGSDDSDTDSQILASVTSGNPNVLKDWLSRLGGSAEAGDRISRTFLSAISDATDECLALLLDTGLVNIHSKDEINERNCLHEAAIYGNFLVLRTGISGNVDVQREDVYGRIPLHYACIHGRVGMMQVLMDANPLTINAKDHDNFTPLIHSIVHQRIDGVQLLLAREAEIDPKSDSDHVPLNLACQYGLTLVAKLLLEKNARLNPDAEGLFPQHVVARSGQDGQLLLLLQEFGANLDEIDKFNQWTPLFHAASEGNVACLQTLLQNGARVDILDEKQLSAMYYAAWEGHLECMKLLGSNGSVAGLTRQPWPAPAWSQETTDGGVGGSGEETGAGVVDGIPDLSLPPPFIPLRRYGHNFLDSKTFVQLVFEVGSDSILFYNDSKYPAARLTLSSKLSDLIPRNILLPVHEDNRMIAFQIDNLDTFTIDFDIFPTFGAKVIAKTVALSNVFNETGSSSGRCCLPLFDPRLRAIGQIGFQFQVIKPFQGTALEITDFATYWKATSHVDHEPSALVTESSLTGDYVRIFVQLTSDSVPVLWPFWTVQCCGMGIPVSRLTCRQFLAFRAQALYGKFEQAPQSDEAYAGQLQAHENDLEAVYRVLLRGELSLKDALRLLPSNVHVDVHVLYPTGDQERAAGLAPTANMNDFVDAILKDVFDHARDARGGLPEAMRSMIFSSFNADVCNALNWKQPNYPVFLCNELGKKNSGPEAASAAPKSEGGRSLSVKESVRIAQSNNLMGLICCSSLLDMVPALVGSIKVAGLILVTEASNGSDDDILLREGIDGTLRENGVLSFKGTIL
ncbi:MAG: hypothetical protein M1825_006037 [Sarcosagium campestre]|nr:MAG: hypothetical protein M1825_006037 [Sarcosagium campestre]